MKTHRKDWFRKKYEHELILSKHQPPGKFSYVLVLDHLKAGFNVGKILRSANALGCHEVHLVGIGMFDPSPAKGALKQTRTRAFPAFSECWAHLKEQGYTGYVLHPSGTEEAGRCELPEKTAFILGHEEFGLSFEATDFPELKRMRIRQYGAVQSLNVSVAASIVAFEYVRQHGLSEEARTPHA